MNTDYTIKNFRIFDKNGATADIRPITILTGCNNSGKSSIVKSICLLKDFCEQIQTDNEDGKNLRLENYKIDFHKRPFDVLGSFKHVLHESTEDDEACEYFTIELVVDSRILMQDVILSLEFGALDGDDLNNAYLHSYSIKTLEGELIFSATYNKGYESNFSIVKKSLLHFIYAQKVAAEWQTECSFRQYSGEFPSEKDVEGDNLELVIRYLYKDLGFRAVIELLEWQVSHCLHSWKDRYTGSASALMSHQTIENAILDSARLGVFLYFPFMSKLVDMDKETIIKTIDEKLILSSLPGLERKMIALFMKEFKKSPEVSIHGFVSEKENSYFFDNSSFFNLQAFELPLGNCNKEVGDVLSDKNDVPEKLTYEVLLLSLDALNKLILDSKKSYIDFDPIENDHNYLIENQIFDFQRKVIEDIFIQIIPGDVFYTGTSVVNLRRMYSLEENNEFVETLKMYFEAKRLLSVASNESYKKSEYIPCTFINKWISEFEIGHHVGIFTHAEGNGVTIRIYQSEEDKKGMLLADKGYGVVQLFVVLLKIEIAIIKSEYLTLRYTYDTHGLAEPMIKALRSYRVLHPATIALEEPENHLHPSFQSKLADLIVDAFQNYGIHFLVESHSEYLIRKLQLLVANKSIDYNHISVLYVNDKNRPKYKNWVENIGIGQNGSLVNEFGPGFFDESVTLANDLYNSKEEEYEG